jgi:putative autotransporter adhesin-like protein
MQKIFLCLLIAFGALNLNAQNIVHDANAQVRNVGSFNKIKVSSAISLYLSQGSTQAVAVSSEDNKVTDRIITEVKNGILKIYVENGAWNGWNWGNKHLKAYVTFTTLEMLDASGACSVELTDPINVGDFKLILSGASNMRGDIKGSNINFDLNGASTGKLNISGTSLTLSESGASTFKGNINAGKTNFDVNGASTADIDGNTTDLIVGASGASNFRGSDLQAVSCKIEATGASSASINVSKDIDATASGASSIHYSGGASLSNVDVSGSSTVKKKS